MEGTYLMKDALFSRAIMFGSKVGLYEIQKTLHQMTLHSPFKYLSQLCEIFLKHENFF